MMCNGVSPNIVTRGVLDMSQFLSRTSEKPNASLIEKKGSANFYPVCCVLNRLIGNQFWSDEFTIVSAHGVMFEKSSMSNSHD